MASCQRLPWIKSLTASLYDIGLEILLLNLVIDIATSFTLPWLSRIAVFSTTICFFGLSLGFGSPIDTFFFDKSTISKNHLSNSFAPHSNLSTYGLLVMTIYLICDAQTQRCFIILELYSMRIPCQTFWLSNFDLFLSGILHNARLPKI